MHSCFLYDVAIDKCKHPENLFIQILSKFGRKKGPTQAATGCEKKRGLL